MYACMHACMHACMYVCMYVCMYACMYRMNQPISQNDSKDIADHSRVDNSRVDLCESLPEVIHIKWILGLVRFDSVQSSKSWRV